MPAIEVPFEEPIIELRRRLEELESYPDEGSRRREVENLRTRLQKTTREVYSGLSRWEKTLVARHSERPYTLDYVSYLLEDWVELHGDRVFADDAAIVAGLGTFRDRSIALIGHQKGRGTKGRIRHNFGQARPEGYRKALRVMHLAEKFALPIVTLVDTPGAFPGIGAEERGQAEAIARNLIEMASLAVPIIVVITGEGGSGGALALGVGDRIYMLEYATYSVISPEGCAAILWKDQQKRADAAEALKLTAPDLLELGVIDGIVPEPLGAAHADAQAAARELGDTIERALTEVADRSTEELIRTRYDRFRRLGAFVER